MLDLGVETKVYLYTAAIDMRKGFDRLSELAREQSNPLRGGLFVFISRRRDRVKILYWEEDGYVLWYKRLEAGTFRVEQRDEIESITGVDLKLLLSGMSLERIKVRKRSKEGIYASG